MRIDQTNSELNDGEFIDLLDVDVVPHGLHVDTERLMWPDNPPEGQAFVPHGRRVRDFFMASVITGWSFGELPHTAQGSGDPEKLRVLPARAYKALREATNPHYIDAGFMRDPAKDKEETETDPSKSTSGPSSSTA